MVVIETNRTGPLQQVPWSTRAVVLASPALPRDGGQRGSLQPAASFQPRDALLSLLGSSSRSQRGGGWRICVLTVNTALLFINAE